MHRFARLLCVPLCLLISLFAFSAQAATLTVTSNADSGTGSLRAAIAAAANGDAINFASDMTITIGSTLTISKNLTIDATGHNVAIDGNASVTVFLVTSSATAAITHLTIQNGRASETNLGYCNGLRCGGGIFNSGTLTLNDSRLLNNTLTFGYGGGVYNDVGGTATLTNCTVSGNSAASGGGVFNYGGPMTISNSTLSGNTASAFGGGIGNFDTLAINNSTVSGNSAAIGGGIDHSGVAITLTNTTLSGNSASNFGSAISVEIGKTTMTNSIVGQGGGSNVLCSIPNISLLITDNGGNFDSGTSCGFTASTSKSNATLNLGPLANNGGPTQTMLPGAGSAAIDAGMDAVCAAAPVNGLDQRGIPRPQGAHCDSGAVEVVVPQTLTVGVTGNGSVSAGASPAPQSGGILSCTNAGGANCSATYATGQSVVLTAVVPSGSNVTWGGACAAAGNSTTATVTMSAAENCTATFALNIATSALTSPSSTSTYGQPVTFVATMAITAASVNMLPTGTVTFLDGGTPIGTGTLTYVGVATFTTSGLSAGSHSITAQYGGDGNFLASAPQPVSNTLTFAVSQKSTTVSLVVAPDHVALGQSITITATVAGDPPTGTVTFTDNGITLPCSPATLVPGATSSTAVCTDTPTGTGSHTIIATYSGDGNYTGATSSSAVVTVNGDSSAAPTLDRWAMMLLGGLLSASVFWRSRQADRHV